MVRRGGAACKKVLLPCLAVRLGRKLGALARKVQNDDGYYRNGGYHRGGNKGNVYRIFLLLDIGGYSGLGNSVFGIIGYFNRDVAVIAVVIDVRKSRGVQLAVAVEGNRYLSMKRL